MRYPRPPRFPILRFGCLGFLFVGWIVYSVFAAILAIWIFGAMIAMTVQLVLGIGNLVNLGIRRRKRRKMSKKYRASSPAWRK